MAEHQQWGRDDGERAGAPAQGEARENAGTTRGEARADGTGDTAAGALAHLRACLDEAQGLVGTGDMHLIEGMLANGMATFVAELRAESAPLATRAGIAIEGAELYASASFEIWLDVQLREAAEPSQNEASGLGDAIYCVRDEGICRALSAIPLIVGRGYVLTQDQCRVLEGLWASVDAVDRYPVVADDLVRACTEPVDIVADRPQIPYASTDAILRESDAGDLRGAAVVHAMSGRHALAHELFAAALEREPGDALAGAYATLLERVREVRSVASTSRLADVAAAFERLPLALASIDDGRERWCCLTRIGSYADHLLCDMSGHLAQALESDHLERSMAARAMAQAADVDEARGAVAAIVARLLAGLWQRGLAPQNFIEYRAWKRCLARVPECMRDEAWAATWAGLRRRYELESAASRRQTERAMREVKRLEREIEEAAARQDPRETMDALEDALVSARIKAFLSAGTFDNNLFEDLD